MSCAKRGCKLTDKQHVRKIEYIENSVGPRAAEDWAWEHRPKEVDRG